MKSHLLSVRSGFLVVASLGLLLAGSFLAFTNSEELPSEFRHWTTAAGKKSEIRLQLLAATDNVVKLKREDNDKIIELPLSNLSAADRAFVQSLRQSQTVEPASKPLTAVRAPAGQTVPVSTTWYQWRGPKRDGICEEKGLLTSWPDDGPPLAWRSKGLGGGMSSVVIGEGKLYTMGHKDGFTKLICVSLADGSPIWETEVSQGNDPNCTPTLDPESGLVFGLSHAGTLLAADAQTGKEVWKKSFPNDFGGKMMSGWGYSESPLIDGNRLICTPGSEQAIIAALDKKTGKPIWGTPAPAGSLGQAGQDGAGYASVVISNAGGIKQYVQLVGRGVIGVAAEDGRPLWNYNRVANGTANVPTPIVYENYIFTSTGYGDGGTALLELTRQGRGIAVKEIYYKPANELQNHHGGMILVGEHVFLGHGHNNGFPACVELKSGKSTWEIGRGPGRESAAIVYADGHLYFRYQDATMALIEANPSELKIKGSFKLASHNGESWPHPVINDGKLYIRDKDELLCYDIRQK